MSRTVDCLFAEFASDPSVSVVCDLSAATQWIVVLKILRDDDHERYWARRPHKGCFHWTFLKR